MSDPPSDASRGGPRGRDRARLEELSIAGYTADIFFAKLKTLLRTAARRTVDALWHAIGQALDTFSPSECNHYLAHARYVPSHRESL